MSESHHPVLGSRIEGDRRESVDDALTREGPLQINLNERAFSVTMRTPGADEALVKGLLFTEGIVSRDARGWEYARRVGDGGWATVVEVTIPEIYICGTYYDRRALVSSSSCGLCGLREWGDPDPDAASLPPGPTIRPDRIHDAFRTMRERQITFEATGGCHGAGAFDADGEVLAVEEDVGRHNAVDKVIGRLLEADRLEDAVLLTVSGRVSFEIVSKAYRAGIPVLAAVSAPSTMAVEMGERLGLTILGFCRAPRLTVYSHPARVDGA